MPRENVLAGCCRDLLTPYLKGVAMRKLLVGRSLLQVCGLLAIGILVGLTLRGWFTEAAADATVQEKAPVPRNAFAN